MPLPVQSVEKQRPLHLVGPFDEPLVRSFAWAKARDWRGIDTRDALKSPLFKAAPAGIRRAATSWLADSSLNPRPFLGIKGDLSPEALALFLSSAARMGRNEDVAALTDLLLEQRSPHESQCCWGQAFSWQSGSTYVPARTPTVEVTSRAALALLDAFELTAESRLLNVALSACRFVLMEVRRFEDSTGSCLSRSPLDRTADFASSLLAVRLLVETARHTGRSALLDEAAPFVQFVLSRQAPDGSWCGPTPEDRDILDAAAMGELLCNLWEYLSETGDPATEVALRRGAAFHAGHFTTAEGRPSPGGDSRAAVDLKTVAVTSLTELCLSGFSPDHLRRARRTGRWMVEHMLSYEGSFHHLSGWNRQVTTPYMRSSQAWGVRALAELAAAAN